MNNLIRTRFGAWVVGGALVIIGILVFVGAAYSSGVWAAILGNVGGAFITIGSVGVIYDSVLKPRLVADIQNSTELAQSGLVQVAPADQLSVSAMPPHDHRVLLVTSSLSSWLDRRAWISLCKEASERQLAIALYCEDLSRLADKDANALRARVRLDWETRTTANRSPAEQKSILNLYECSHRTQVFVYRSGDIAMIGVDAPYSSYNHGSAIGFRIEGNAGAVWEWIRRLETRVAQSTVRSTDFGTGGNTEWDVGANPRAAGIAQVPETVTPKPPESGS